jgi:hypothetical protein
MASVCTRFLDSCKNELRPENNEVVVIKFFGYSIIDKLFTS